MRGLRAEQARVVHLLDELLEHLLGDGEVGDDAVLHGPDRGDVARRAPEHLLGREADLLDHLLAVRPVLPDRDHRGFVQDDALAPRVDQGIGGAEVDCEVVGEIPGEKTEHVVSLVTVARDGASKWCGSSGLWYLTPLRLDKMVPVVFVPFVPAIEPLFSSRSQMALTLDDVTRIAHLARIEITDAEAEHGRSDQLNDIFALIAKMQAVDTSRRRTDVPSARRRPAAARGRGHRNRRPRGQHGERAGAAGRPVPGAQGDRVSALARRDLESAELSRRWPRKRISAVELAQLFLARIEAPPRPERLPGRPPRGHAGAGAGRRRAHRRAATPAR